MSRKKKFGINKNYVMKGDMSIRQLQELSVREHLE